MTEQEKALALYRMAATTPAPFNKRAVGRFLLESMGLPAEYMMSEAQSKRFKLRSKASKKGWRSRKKRKLNASV